MTARTFVDSNVWIYAVDSADPRKQRRAIEVTDPSASTDLVISSQVLGEVYVTVTRKFERTVSPDDARRLIDQLRRLPVVAIDAGHVAAAIQGSQEWGIAYWDALIIAAASSAGCSRLLSEDLSDGQTYGTVRVENPLRQGHRLAETASPYVVPGAAAARWDDRALFDELARYERECVDSGMKPNAVHSYTDYARRFLDWRTGAYRPRGASSHGRPVPSEPVSVEELTVQARSYGQAVAAAGRQQATIDTYQRHAMFYVRWLQGSFHPGARRARFERALTTAGRFESGTGDIAARHHEITGESTW